MKTGKLLAIFLLIFIFGCQVNDESEAAIPKARSAETELASYAFLMANNPGLTADLSAVISGPNIRLLLPEGVEADKLVATYVTRSGKSKLYVGDTEQVSGVTANTFSKPVYYKIALEEGAAINFSVEMGASFSELDEALQAAMQRYNIPGLSVAIVKNEKLVVTRSYGYANIETNELVKNDSKFRIASVSKPITATAILKLVQEGRLSLNDKVFGTNGILKNTYGTPKPGSLIDQITVEQLLEHKSGWANEPNDPLFSSASLSHQQLIIAAVQNMPLKFKPGTTFYYSNLGYCILGRIIEKVTGMTYAGYISAALLTPSGISDMQIAGNTYDLSYSKEVKYYQSGSTAYQYNITRMDANGGWVATATDLMRFMVRIDRNNAKNDLVDSSLLSRNYLGFSNWSHSGSLPGTSSMLTRLNDEFSFVILANTRNDAYPLLIAEEINNIIKEKILENLDWPDIDLFENNSELIQYAVQQ